MERGRVADARSGRWLLPVGTAVLVFVLAWVAATQRPEGSNVAVWWPAAGVAVAAYVLAWRRAQRVQVLLAILVGVLAGELLGGYEVEVAVSYALANLANPVLCVWLFHRTTPALLLRDGRDYARFCVSAFFAATVTAGIASLVVCVFIDDDPWAAYRAVLPSHLSAMLVLAPIALLAPRRRPARAGRAETVLQFGSTVLVSAYVLSPWQDLPLTFLCLGFLIWGAARVPMLWLYVEVVLFAGCAAVFTTIGGGGYDATLMAHDVGPETLTMVLDIMLAGVAVAVYPLALAMEVHRSSLAEARESRELLDSVLAGATGNAIIGADLDGVVRSWNAGAERIFGWSTAEVAGLRTLGSLRPGPARPASRGLEPGIAALVAPLSAGSDWVDQDWDCVRQDGRPITVAFRLTARRSVEGAIVGWIAVGEDVTEKRRTERALQDAFARERQAVQRLEELDTVRTSFVHSVSHELRTPLTNVLGYTEMLLEEQFGEVNPSQRKMLHSVSRNGRRLHKLIEDLLTLSRIEQGSFSALAEPVDLSTAVRRGYDALAPQAEAASVRVDLDLGAGPVPVVGDPEQLERVTANLLGNAVKFSAGGSVAVALHRDDREAVLTVSDQGMGIPSAELTRLFDRFFRSSNAQRAEVQGSGLGLVIVKEIVDHHHGRIEVDSEEGVGTTVRVRLPLQAPAGSLVGAGGPTSPS